MINHAGQKTGLRQSGGDALKKKSLKNGFPARALFLCVFAAAAAPVTAPAQSSAENTATLQNFKLPEYREKDNKLELIIYGDKAEAAGMTITLSGVLIDMIRDDVSDVAKVKDMSSVKIYPLNEKKDGVDNFWKTAAHSKGMLTTPGATFDRATKIVSGKDAVRFRSPSMDADGLGFEADTEKKTIWVKSNVRMVYRKDAGGPGQPAKPPEKPATEKGDSNDTKK
jgi:hypothetical protein